MGGFTGGEGGLVFGSGIPSRLEWATLDGFIDVVVECLNYGPARTVPQTGKTGHSIDAHATERVNSCFHRLDPAMCSLVCYRVRWQRLWRLNVHPQRL